MGLGKEEGKKRLFKTINRTGSLPPLTLTEFDLFQEEAENVTRTHLAWCHE